jgi:UDPglucose 6-dehydrogenase
MKISIIGGGYVGTVTGACLADLGNEVTIVEIDKKKIEMINRAVPPLYEPGLADLLEKNSGHLHATDDVRSAVETTDVTFICVGTPSREDGSIDLSYIEAAAADIGKILKRKAGYHVIVVKSTVIPGTCDSVVAPTVARYSGKSLGVDFSVCSNPEFLREGKAVYDFFHPDRIVLGSEDQACIKVLRAIYEPFTCPVIECPAKTAEMIKYVSNSFLALKVSFANEIGNLSKTLGIDSYTVFEGAGLDSRIGPLFFNAGLGFGGSCFPKDVIALQRLGESLGMKMVLLDAALAVNQEQPGRAVALLERHLSLPGSTIGILGLAFKPDTDDIREARSIGIVSSVLSHGARIIAYDPMAMDHFRKLFPEITYASSAQDVVRNSDATIIVTEWKEFEDLDYSGKIVIDGRRLLKSRDTAAVYEGVCW